VLFQVRFEEAPEARNDVQSLSGFAFCVAIYGQWVLEALGGTTFSHSADKEAKRM
jgi:hypothetical protein